MKLHIAINFTLPAEAVTQTFAILGIRGSGKTNTGVVMTEELLHAKQQVVVIDPVDVWWGLKSSKDGKQPGYALPVIGGDHADVPLDGGAGQVLADFVTETRASVILSLRHLSMNDQRKFAGDFAKRLYERKGQQRSPLMLMVDEADEFVPQRLPHGHEAMFGAFDRLVRRGRSSGIGVTLISQRPQVVNKDVLSQVETLIGMRVLHKLDRKALEAWIEAHDTEARQQEFLDSLASLGRGDAWIWSPSWLNVFTRVHIRERKTFDSSATPTAGASIAPPKEVAPLDLDKLRNQMSAQIQKAQADDPRALRAEIARLQAELKKKPAPVKAGHDDAALDRAREKGRQQGRVEVRGQLAGLSSCKHELVKAAQIVNRSIEFIQGLLDLPMDDLAPSVAIAESRTMPARTRKPEVSPKPSVDRPTSSSSPNAGIGSSGLRRMLMALAQWSRPLSAKQLGVRAGMSSRSGTFSTYLGKARSSGWITGSRDGLTITKAGTEELGSFEPLPTGRKLLDYWLGELGGGAARMLEVLAVAYPESLTADSLGESADISSRSGTFSTYLGKLRTLELISGGRDGLRASEDLFE